MLGVEVIPVLGGPTRPPAPINFTGSFPGADEFSPRYDLFPGDPFELGWWLTGTTQNSRIHEVIPALDQPVGGFSEGLAMVVSRGSMTLTTDVVDTQHIDAFDPDLDGDGVDDDHGGSTSVISKTSPCSSG